MAPAIPEHTNIRPLLPLYLVILIGFLGYSMMVTLFVPMLMHQSSGFLPTGATTAQRTTMLGILLALYPMGQFFGSPVIGALSDRFGRKPVLLISLVITTACYGLICLALERQWLLLLGLACMACGLSESNITLAQSAVADVSTRADRGRLFGYIYTTTSISYIIGPLVGGWLAEHYGYALPFWIVLGLLVVTLAWTRVSFRETHAPKPGQVVRYFAALTNLLSVFTDRPIRRLYLVNFLVYLASLGFWRAILMYMVDEWQMSVHQTTLYYAYLAAMSIVASFGLMPRFSGRVSMQRLAIDTAILAGLLVIAIVIPASEASLLFTAGPASLVATLTLSACAALLSSSVSEERQGSVMGNNQALQVGAESLGVFVAGLMAGVVVKLPLAVFGGVLVLAALLLVPFRRPALGDVSGKGGQHGRENDQDRSDAAGF
jgi:MFS family permease